MALRGRERERGAKSGPRAKTPLSLSSRDVGTFSERIRSLRVAAEAEQAQLARKLVDSLDEASDVDLSELKIPKRSMMTMMNPCGPYGPPPGPYGGPPPPYGGFPPMGPYPGFPCPPPGSYPPFMKNPPMMMGGK